MIEKKRLAKSKKKNIELIRDCMKILQIVTNMKTYEDDLEDKLKPGSKNKPLLSLEDIDDVDEETVKFDLKFASKVKTARLKTPIKSQKKKKIGNNSPARKFAS